MSAVAGVEAKKAARWVATVSDEVVGARHLKQRPWACFLKSSGMECPRRVKADGRARACTGRRCAARGAGVVFALRLRWTSYQPWLASAELLSSLGALNTGRHTFTGAARRGARGWKEPRRPSLSGTTRRHRSHGCYGWAEVGEASLLVAADGRGGVHLYSLQGWWWEQRHKVAAVEEAAWKGAPP